MTKKTKSQIKTACERVGLSEFWTACMIEMYDQQIKRSKANKQPVIIAEVKSVSSSGMSRKISVGMVRKNGMYQNITPAICALYGDVKLQDCCGWCFTVKGCGMDMIYHTLETVFYRLIPAEGRKNYETISNLCRYELF
jgi:hypothetical protein